MNDMIRQCTEEIACGQEIRRREALELMEVPLEELKQAANEIRKQYAADLFDMCTIINGKCGRCSEDCKYCAQSAHFKTESTETYPLLSTKEMLQQAKYNEERGILRYSIVTSGRRLSEQEIDQVCESIRAIRQETQLSVCVSFGLLQEKEFRKLKEAGVSRVHCNMESSRSFFQEICTTHSYDDKITTLLAAKQAGLEICSGGIIGLGEEMEDRIDMALTVRGLGVKSIPVNVLNPIPGTPFEHRPVLSNDELCRTVAIFRFLIPDGFIRLAGGRGLLPDAGRECFLSGANAAISGDMLTTAGTTIESDLALIHKLGYQVRKITT